MIQFWFFKSLIRELWISPLFFSPRRIADPFLRFTVFIYYHFDFVVCVVYHFFEVLYFSFEIFILRFE
ncbi:hypothetical protein MTR67_028427 [Solanum verrucosum]|uniref:Uncharacterized protein n=1 Tax=Solanum verrucosum TaxID=315347 RepID=A0AAF0R753_SOLVR|nr:hypothetical protein MTR67_028427 [Solanum verrucosum]